MPYIVTAVKDPAPDVIPPSVARRAVATLEGREVWNSLYGVEIPNREQVVKQIAALPESGGTVGPLPDGTVIKVFVAGWIWLSREAGEPFRSGLQRSPKWRTEIVDAYNARESAA